METATTVSCWQALCNDRLWSLGGIASLDALMGEKALQLGMPTTLASAISKALKMCNKWSNETTPFKLTVGYSFHSGRLVLITEQSFDSTLCCPIHSSHKTFRCSPQIISGDWHTAGIRIPFSVSIFSLSGSQNIESYWKALQLDSNSSERPNQIHIKCRCPSNTDVSFQRIFGFFFILVLPEATSFETFPVLSWYFSIFDFQV